jgi:hypothetical protein
MDCPKRKRCVDMSVLLDELSSTQVQHNEIDMLVSDFETIVFHDEYAEYQLLVESVEYVFEPHTVRAYIRAAEKRFVRYLKAVNFYEFGYAFIKDHIECFLNSNANDKVKVGMIKEIDQFIMDGVEEATSSSAKKATLLCI